MNGEVNNSMGLYPHRNFTNTGFKLCIHVLNIYLEIYILSRWQAKKKRDIPHYSLHKQQPCFTERLSFLSSLYKPYPTSMYRSFYCLKQKWDSKGLQEKATRVRPKPSKPRKSFIP